MRQSEDGLRNAELTVRSDAAREIAMPLWGAMLDAAVSAAQQNTTAGPARLVKLADVVHFMTNAPDPWYDRQRTMIIWALGAIRNDTLQIHHCE